MRKIRLIRLKRKYIYWKRNITQKCLRKLFLRYSKLKSSLITLLSDFKKLKQKKTKYRNAILKGKALTQTNELRLYYYIM